MPAQITDVMMLARPFWEIKERLEYHSRNVEGRILRYCDVDMEGSLESRGVEDLPYILPFTLTDQEVIGSGAVPSGQTAGSSNFQLTQTLTIAVVSRRDYGMVRDDPTTQSEKKKGILEWIACLRDAIETDTDGNPDAMLKNSVMSPPTYQTRDIGVSELGWEALVEVTLVFHHWSRAGRTETGSIF